MSSSKTKQLKHINTFTYETADHNTEFEPVPNEQQKEIQYNEGQGGDKNCPPRFEMI